jgi:hypothetical protein
MVCVNPQGERSDMTTFHEDIAEESETKVLYHGTHPQNVKSILQGGFLQTDSQVKGNKGCIYVEANRS